MKRARRRERGRLPARDFLAFPVGARPPLSPVPGVSVCHVNRDDPGRRCETGSISNICRATLRKLFCVFFRNCRRIGNLFRFLTPQSIVPRRRGRRRSDAPLPHLHPHRCDLNKGIISPHVFYICFLDSEHLNVMRATR